MYQIEIEKLGGKYNPGDWILILKTPDGNFVYGLDKTTWNAVGEHWSEHRRKVKHADIIRLGIPIYFLDACEIFKENLNSMDYEHNEKEKRF